MVAFLAEVPGGDMPTYNTNIAVIRMRERALRNHAEVLQSLARMCSEMGKHPQTDVSQDIEQGQWSLGNMQRRPPADTL